MVTRSEAVANFLNASAHPDLAARYNFNMEVQVNVAKDNGEKTSGEYKEKTWYGWTDGMTTWKSFRIPYNANTHASYEDRPIKFDLAAHVEGIGMTGWDWGNCVSRWVAFDFDSMIGHTRSGLPPEVLRQVQECATKLPYIELRKSTSGNGLHIYVIFDEEGVHTANHNEHAALARAVLARLSLEAKFDFNNKVDICGGNMWVWHRKMTKENGGLILLKPATEPFTATNGWQNHIKVVTGRKPKTVPDCVEETDELEKEFALLTGQYDKVPLTEGHKRLLTFLEQTKAQWWWDQDAHMLITHTIHLRDAHRELNMRGIFNTISTGKEAGNDHNCFCFPLANGGWVIRRFSQGVKEAATWHSDRSNWTTCYLDVDPTLRVAAVTYDGAETPKGGFMFESAEQGIKAVESLGGRVDVPPSLMWRPMEVKTLRDGRLVVSISKEAQDAASKLTLPGWIAEPKKYTKVLNTRTRTTVDACDCARNFDHLVRHLIVDNKDAGWVVNTNVGWNIEPSQNVRIVLKSEVGANEFDNVYRAAVSKPWELVNIPFAPEYPGDRVWNRGACQLNFMPSQIDPSALRFPMWKQLLTHVGKSLDIPISDLAWCREWGINTGFDYLATWVACLIRHPEESLPYLFLYGTEATGKSSFHEAVSLLFSSNYTVRAGSSLLNAGGFNGELEGVVLCVIEEIDLSTNKSALQRMKDWVVAKTLSIHRKCMTPYNAPNYTHWVQCSNDLKFCPVFPGDTRVTVIHVDMLPPDTAIPKTEMHQKLIKEAPDFLQYILNLPIKKSVDRHKLPVISSHEKIVLQELNKDNLTRFIESSCFHSPGEKILFSDFYQAYINSVEADESPLDQKTVKTMIRPPYVVGRATDNKTFIGNISFTEPDPDIIRRGNVLPYKLLEDGRIRK